MAKKKTNLELMVKVAQGWLGEESNLYIEYVVEHKKLQNAKGTEKDTKRSSELDGEICRLVDEYIADSKRTLAKWLELTDDEYQGWLRRLAELRKNLTADAHDDLEPIVAEIREVQAKMKSRIEAEILKGGKHVDICLVVVEHEETLDKIRMQIAEQTMDKDAAQKLVTSIGNEIKRLVASLEKRIADGPSAGVLFDHADKEEQKKKQIEADIENGCEVCDEISKVKANKYIFNEHGVCTNPDRIDLKFKKSLKCKAYIEYAQGPGGKWYYGYDITVGTNHAGRPVSNNHNRKRFETKEEAIDQAATEVKEWLKKKNPAGLDAIIATIDKQVKSAEK